MSLKDRLESKAEKLALIIEVLLRRNTDNIQIAVDLISSSLDNYHRVYIIGNGGSAADAQHFAAELMGRFKVDRDPLPVMALTTDTSLLTAVANDYGYEEVFSRQLKGLVEPGDTVICLSTSGMSKNILKAAGELDIDVNVIALTGNNATPLTDWSDCHISVPSNETDLIQEVHMFLLHAIADEVEKKFS